MGYARLSGSVAALAGAAMVMAWSSAGSAPIGDKVKVTNVDPAVLKGLPQFPVPLRKSITALSATELASLRRGFAQMIAWNSEPHGSANFRRSLLYWANMHSYIGSGCTATNNGINNPGMSGISIQSKSNPDENATWCTCQHSPQNGNNLNFLTWHRMYLYYFEKVLQAAAGDATLRLPYWDYETDGHLPAAYRSPTYVNSGGTTVPNPLYIANRQAQLNSGAAALIPSVVSTAGAMPATSYSPFNQALEQTPHGSVHCATGVASCPSGYMGYVPTAGNDPIFYSHHANIDRLYECWLKVDPAQRLPTGATLNASFNFIDGAGNQVTRQVADMVTTQQLHYGYTSGGGCPLAPIKLPPVIWQVQPWKVYPLLGPTPLIRGRTVVPLRLAPEIRGQILVQPSANAAPARQATLVLDGLAYDEAPGVMYEVALQAPNGKRVVIGIISFFNETAPRHDNMAGMETAAPAGRKTFDATAALRALGGPADAQLVLEPTAGVTGVSAAAAAAKINARANVRFAAARLELR